MAEPKDTTSFFRKVVKFVANPAMEWSELAGDLPENRESDFAKSELKAMIERKRRNDFVRKRELDMLRKVRREGLSSEQLAALGMSSRLDDSELKLADSGVRADSGVKAKIDEIEQQMVSESTAGATRRNQAFFDQTTQAAALVMPRLPDGNTGSDVAGVVTDSRHDRSGGSSGEPPPKAPRGARPGVSSAAEATPVAPAPPAATRRSVAPQASSFGPDPLSPALSRPFAAESSDVAHDPELDEAVISFANADFDACEQSLSMLTSPQGRRSQHAETWLALFDLYRAIGQQSRFEALAVNYVHQFGWSPPQWFSLPQLVAEMMGDERPKASRIDGQVGWICAEVLDVDAVARLRAQSLQMPLPWVFDWNELRRVDVDACALLSELFRHWIGQKLDMRWLGGDKLFTVLQEAAPTGVRDADPVYWQLRLDALRMTHRPDQFDETAIDYCITYEVSPPSWVPALCRVRVSRGEHSTASPALSMVSEVSTSFVESQLGDEPALVKVATIELSGQLVGDIGPTLDQMERQLGDAAIVHVSCARLIRVDFIAAGGLLNWVLSRRRENRSVTFTEAHRLTALFFGAMGINEHARVKVRTV